MTPHDPLYFLYLGLVFGIGFTGMLVGLIIIWKDRPKRNCDIGTPEEQCDRFDDYCADHADLEGYDMCKGCPLENTHDCRIVWVNMPYKKEDKQ